MGKVIAFGLAAGAGIQAWRGWPADGPVSMRAGVLVMVVAVVAAYLGGRARRGSAAVAVATATATATAAASAQQAVQVAVIVPREQPQQAVRVPNDAVDWFGGQRPQLDVDQLDGMDLTDFAEQQVQGEAR